jgi:uroporphyrin-III C-methyltransferase / precorrin-2 dehydrogenase / sirohydrochlorin ferrochelatase
MSEARQAETLGFPIVLNLTNRRVLVVGDGDEAAAHVRLVLPTGATIAVVAPVPCDALAELEADGRIELHRRDFQRGDLEGVRLCIVTSRDAEAVDAIAVEADAKGIPLNVVDRPDLSTFGLAAVDCGAKTIAFSRGGTALGLVHDLRAHIELAVQSGLAVTGASCGDGRVTEAAAMPLEVHRREFRDAAIGEPEADAALESDRVDIRHLRAASPVSVRRAKPAGRASLVGAGPGDPELLTLRAARALTHADVVLYDALIDPAVLNLARRDARRIDVGKRCGRHVMSQTAINRLLVRLAQSGAHVVRLKGGDPTVFGRAGEELAALRSAGIPVEVIPGVTAACAAAAQLAVPLTHRGAARSLHFITGHGADGTVPAHDWTALAHAGGTIVAYMAARKTSFLAQRLIAAGMSPSMPAVTIENVSRPDERHIFASLGQLSDMLGEQHFDGPALVLIGTVVALARQNTGTLARAA